MPGRLTRWTSSSVMRYVSILFLSPPRSLGRFVPRHACRKFVLPPEVGERPDLEALICRPHKVVDMLQLMPKAPVHSLDSHSVADEHPPNLFLIDEQNPE